MTNLSTYVYNATLDYVIDGDTARMFIDLGFKTFQTVIMKHDGEAHGVSCRFYGINAPELGTPEGPPAKNALEGKLTDPEVKHIRVRSHDSGKYGRALVTVYTSTLDDPSDDPADWLDVNQWMLDNGFAVVDLP